jgi:hypothetical protein
MFGVECQDFGLDSASLDGMVNGHRVFRFSEAVAAVDKEQ